MKDKLFGFFAPQMTDQLFGFTRNAHNHWKITRTMMMVIIFKVCRKVNTTLQHVAHNANYPHIKLTRTFHYNANCYRNNYHCTKLTHNEKIQILTDEKPLPGESLLATEKSTSLLWEFSCCTIKDWHPGITTVVETLSKELRDGLQWISYGVDVKNKTKQTRYDCWSTDRAE